MARQELVTTWAWIDAQHPARQTWDGQGSWASPGRNAKHTINKASTHKQVWFLKGDVMYGLRSTGVSRPLMRIHDGLAEELAPQPCSSNNQYVTQRSHDHECGQPTASTGSYSIGASRDGDCTYTEKPPMNARCFQPHVLGRCAAPLES
jgi:hypothetical protein